MIKLTLSFVYYTDRNSLDSEKVSLGNKVISLENWRSITTSVGKPYIDLVALDFNNFRLYNTTLDEFLFSSQNKQDLKKEGETLISSLSCRACGGSGITDWISNICKRKTSQTVHGNLRTAEEFERDDTVAFKVSYYKQEQRNKIERRIGYFSIAKIDPKLEGGIELCKSCSGTGFLRFNRIEHVRKENLITNKTF